MMTIRNAQMQALQEQVNRLFAERFSTRLRLRRTSEAPLNEQDLQARLCQLIARAQANGLMQERDVFAFVELSLLKGDGFDADPVYAAILTDPRHAPGTRMRNLLDFIIAQNLARQSIGRAVARASR